MNSLQLRNPFDIVAVNLSDLIGLPDPEAAEALNARMGALDHIHRIHERSYSERGIIAREFERRGLWKHLIDPEAGQPFPNFSAWMSCSDFMGCRRTNFEAKKDMAMLDDVPSDKLIDVPKGNLKVLTQLSTAVRNDPSVLDAAKRLTQDEFLAKVEKEHVNQHLETRRELKFHPGRSWAKDIETTISYALENGIAATRDEALWRMAESALEMWRIDGSIPEQEEAIQ